MKNTFICNYYEHSKVRRSIESKFYMTSEEYSPEEYPPYCDGPAYMFTTDLVKPYYDASHYIKQFVFEDVYMGLLALKHKSTFLNIKEFYVKKGNWTNATNIDSKYFLLARDFEEYNQFWNFVYNRTLNFLRNN
jgi:hypothetical protein